MGWEEKGLRMLSWDEVRLDEGRAAPCILHCPSALSFALENPKLSALSPRGSCMARLGCG